MPISHTSAAPEGVGALGTTAAYQGRGLFVPHGYSVQALIEAANCLEHDFGVAPYLSRHMAAMVLLASGKGASA